MAASHGLLLWLLLLLNDPPSPRPPTSPTPPSPSPSASRLFNLRLTDALIHRNELAGALRVINIWLHPNETTALIEALDEDNSDCIDEAEFILFWNRTT